MPTLFPVNVEEYRSTCIELSALIKAAYCKYIIIGDNFNTSLVQSNRHQEILTKFMSEEALVCGLSHQCSNVKFSYESKSNHCHSILDHILVSCNLFDKIHNYQCLYEIDNLSDHFPVSMDLEISVDTLNKSVHALDNVTVHINWDKIKQSDILNYQYILDEYLNTSANKYDIFHCNDFECTNRKHKHEIQSLYTSIVESCLSAGNVTFTNKTSETKKQGQKVPGWSVFVKGPKEKALFWHSIWKANGCPNAGLLASIRRSTRAEYHRAIKYVKQQKEAIRANNMADSLLHNNSGQFWSAVK